MKLFIVIIPLLQMVAGRYLNPKNQQNTDLNRQKRDLIGYNRLGNNVAFGYYGKARLNRRSNYLEQIMESQNISQKYRDSLLKFMTQRRHHHQKLK